MQAGWGDSEQAVTWYVEPDHVRLNPRLRRAALRLAAGEDTTSAHAVILSSVFLILLAASLLFGGHAAIDPILRSAISARNSVAVGEVVRTMPDGKFCRHMSFDNVTAEIIEGTITPCPSDIAKNEFGNKTVGFAWGTH